MQNAKFFSSKTKMLGKYLLSFILFLAIFLIIAQQSIIFPANAGSWWETAQQGGLKEVGNTYGQETTPTDLTTFIALIINVLLGLLGIIFVVLIIIAGFKWMTAQGNEEKVNEAKSQITTGVIGLIVILSSFALARFILNLAMKASTNVTPIW